MENGTHEPEETERCRNLWLAVIIQSLTDLHHSDPAIKQDAQEFLDSDDFDDLLCFFDLDQCQMELIKKVQHTRFISRHRNESKERFQFRIGPDMQLSFV